MAHKTLVNGTAYEISGGKTIVNGTAYEIKNGKTLVGGTSYEIGFGVSIGSLEVGSSVFINVNGVPDEFLVVHQGLPSSKYDSSCDGTWLLKKHVHYSNQYSYSWDTTDNSYADSDIHAYLNSSFLGLFDSNIQSIIKQVKIPYRKGTGTKGSTVSGSDGLSTKIFLLSALEVGYSGTTFHDNGDCLSYFVGATNTTRKYRCIYEDYPQELYSFWWLRSPKCDDTNYIAAVSDRGGVGYQYKTLGCSIRSAFIIPSETPLDDNFNIIP